MSVVTRPRDSGLGTQSQGFAIVADSKSEETAAPIANHVSLPLMFLSGVFFSRSSSISVDGASLWTVRGDMLGIFVWLAISVVLATRLFKWEVV